MSKMGKRGMSAKQLLQKVDSDDKELEANLSTMMQHIRVPNNFGFSRRANCNAWSVNGVLLYFSYLQLYRIRLAGYCHLFA